MVLTDILPCERVGVSRGAQRPVAKDGALRAVARLLAEGHARAGEVEIHRVLAAREALQSTGIGDGVAIPHGSLEGLDHQVAALLVCPDGVPFDALDGGPVRIVFAVVGPKRATGEHLKTLARVSRLLRDASLRERLLEAREGVEAYGIVHEAEHGRPAG